MAQGKKAFVVYTDWKKYIDDLNDAQVGKWVKWMFDYCNDENPAYPKDTAVKMLCKITQDILKRDLKKYEAKRERILKNGKQYRTEIDTKSVENKTDIDTEIDTEIDTDIIPVNSNKLIVNSNTIKENSIKEKSTQSRFIPPSIEEIQAYVLEKNYNIDSERFFDFYQSKGWMVGKNKMKDWKAAVRNWNKTDNPKTTKSSLKNNPIDEPNGGFTMLNDVPITPTDNEDLPF